MSINNYHNFKFIFRQKKRVKKKKSYYVKLSHVLQGLPTTKYKTEDA